MNIVLAGPPDAVAAQVGAYRAAWEANRRAPDRLNGHVAAPKIGANYKVFVADTDQQALAVARPAQRQHHNSLVKLWHDFGVELTGPFFTDDLDEMIAGKLAVVGSPTRVREQVGESFATSGCNYLVCHMHFGGMTHAQALRSLQFFAEEVMPAFAGSEAGVGAGTR